MLFRTSLIVFLFFCFCVKANGQGVYIVEKPGWAATDKKVLEIISENPGNKEIIKSLHEKKLLIVIKEGLEVFVNEKDAEMDKIQPVGSDISLWVFEDILKKKK